jgi:hypothetical protein
VNENKILRYNWSMPLDAVQNAFVQRVDGHRSIAKIVDDVTKAGELATLPDGEATAYCLALFQSLWRLDFLAMKLKIAQL